MNMDYKEVSSQFLAGRHRLMAFILGLIRNPSHAEDIFQEVWIRLAETLEKGESIRDLPKWCRGVARNLILQHWRKERNAKVIANSEILDIAEVAFSEQDAAAEFYTERRNALVECVGTLPEKSKEILHLKYDSNLSFEAIAARWRKSLGSVMMHLSRVRRILAECVDRRLSMKGSSI